MKYIFTILCIACLSCQQKKLQVEKAQIPLREQITTLDPANAYDAISLSVTNQTYEQLYEYHYLKRPYTLQPLLATSLPSVDQNGTRYTIKIKPQIAYHPDPAFKGNTRYVKAIDFIHQIKRIALVKTRSNGWFLFKDMIVGLDQFREQAKEYSDILNMNVAGLQAVDDLTLVIQLTRPYPQLPYILAMGFTSPIPFEAIQHYQNDLSSHMVGTGPFQMLQWNRGLNLTMEKTRLIAMPPTPLKATSLPSPMAYLKMREKPFPLFQKLNSKL